MKKFLLPVLAVMMLCVVQQSSAAGLFNYVSSNPAMQEIINEFEVQLGSNRGLFEQVIKQLMQDNPGQIKKVLSKTSSATKPTRPGAWG